MALLSGLGPPRRKARGVLAVALASLLHAGSPGSCRAGESLQMMEQKIKAGLLYNFLKYTEWPRATAASAVAVCVFGDDPFRGSLEPMAERTVNRRPITLRHVREVPRTEGCHLVFVNAAERDRWPELAAFLAGKSVLTVSDFPEFVSAGGMIELGQKGDRIDVKVNMAALASAGLQVQERLLRLAHVVDAGGP